MITETAMVKAATLRWLDQEGTRLAEWLSLIWDSQQNWFQIQWKSAFD